jgi:histidinol-phosphate aminotransferase
MVLDYRSLANNYISDLIPYQPGKPIEEVERELGINSIIKLASNENALGASPNAIIAAQNALLKSHIYPDGSCYELKKILADFLNVYTNQLTIGNGSENVLEIIVNSYLSKDDEAVISQYAFLTIPLLIKRHGAHIIKVPAVNYGHDIKTMITAVTEKTRVIFIVNPNNPTGTYVTHDDLKLLLESVSQKVIVVIDEAYSEYITHQDYPKTLELLSHYPNLIVTRTFSKVYGLAALRLGYAVASSEITDILNRARLPFNVNSIAASAGTAAILDQDHVAKSVKMNNEGLRQLEDGLHNLKINFIPSVGNFITIDIKSNALDIYQKLLALGVIVRPLLAYDMPTHLRVTVGTIAENERFLETMHKIMRK